MVSQVPSFPLNARRIEVAGDACPQRLTIEIVKPSNQAKGFVVLPKR
jgi:hypothetical protein